MPSIFRPVTVLLIICLITGALLAVSCGGGTTASDAESGQLSAEESDYLEVWDKTAAALLDFSMVELEALDGDTEEMPSLTELVSPYQDKRDAFQAALQALERASVPSSLADYHSQLIPLYRGALDDMDSIIDAASQDDEASFMEAKAGLIDTLEQTTEIP